MQPGGPVRPAKVSIVRRKIYRWKCSSGCEGILDIVDIDIALLYIVVGLMFHLMRVYGHGYTRISWGKG